MNIDLLIINQDLCNINKHKVQLMPTLLNNRFLIFSIIILFVFISCKNKKLNTNKTDNIESSINDDKQLLDSLSENYSSDNDSLILFSNYILSKNPQNEKQVNIKIAHIHYEHSNYYLAQKYFTNAAQAFLKDSLIEKYAEQITNIGVTKEVSGNYPGAIDDYLKAQNIFDSLNLPEKSSYIDNNIGIIYEQLKDKNKALKYYHKSLKTSLSLGKEKLSATRYNNLASLYESSSLLDSALFFYKKAYHIYQKDSSLNKLIAQGNIGHVYLLKKEFITADSILEITYQTFLEQGFQTNSSYVLSCQAQSFLEQGFFQKSQERAKQAYQISQQNGNKEKELKSLDILIKSTEKLQLYKQANQLLKNYYQIKEDLSGLEQNKFINQLNIKYQVKEQKHKIQVLELNNNVQNEKMLELWLFIIILVALLLGLYIILRLQKKNDKLFIKQMQRDISDYIAQIEEIKESKDKIEESLTQEKKENKKQNKTHILDKIKQFDLTEREQEVLILISQGYKNAEIAEKLFLSINTIKTHTKNIFIKLDVRNRIEATRKTQIS